MVLVPTRDITRLVSVLKKDKAELEKKTVELGVQVATVQAENMQLKTDLATQKSLVEVERGATQLQKKECERLHKELAQQSRTSAEKEGLAEVSFKRREREANDRVATAGREVDQWKESYNVLEKERDELEKKCTELKRRMKKKGVRMESTDDELEGAMNAPEADDYDDDMV